jgi:hypothetical protein
MLSSLTSLLAPAEQDHAARHSHLVIACHFWRPGRHQVPLLRIVLPSCRSVKREPFYFVLVTRGNATIAFQHVGVVYRAFSTGLYGAGNGLVTPGRFGAPWDWFQEVEVRAQLVVLE